MTREFPAAMDAVPELVSFTAQTLEGKHFNEKLLEEYRLLVEEITIKLVEKARTGAMISVHIYRRLGSLNIRIGCPGEPVTLYAEGAEDFGGQIIESFGDYLRQSYTAGTNFITFSSAASNDILKLCCLSLGLSIVTALALRAGCSPWQRAWIGDNILDPTVMIFTNCLQTMAIPVAFFSIASFLIKLQMTLERDERILRLALRYFLSSLMAIAVGWLLWQLYRHLGWVYDISAYRVDDRNFMGRTLREFLVNAVPENIVEPLMITNPIPMLVLAVMLGYAASHLFGAEGNSARRAIRMADGLFCRMMNLVYGMIPFFLFFALLRRWLESGSAFFGRLALTLGFFVPAILVVLVLYLLQLFVSGIRPREFIRQYGDMLWENLKIGSNIQALPYNKRMLYRRSKLPRDFLDEGLRLGSVMNMDGNCAMVTLGILMMVTGAQIDLSIPQSVGMALILLLISQGAPNQPGSFLLAMVVLCSYVGISGEIYPDILIIEAALGKFYSFLNSAGDITTVLLVGRKMGIRR